MLMMRREHKAGGDRSCLSTLPAIDTTGLLGVVHWSALTMYVPVALHKLITALLAMGIRPIAAAIVPEYHN